MLRSSQRPPETPARSTAAPAGRWATAQRKTRPPRRRAPAAAPALPCRRPPPACQSRRRDRRRRCGRGSRQNPRCCCCCCCCHSRSRWCRPAASEQRVRVSRRQRQASARAARQHACMPLHSSVLRAAITASTRTDSALAGNCCGATPGAGGGSTSTMMMDTSSAMRLSRATICTSVLTAWCGSLWRTDLAALLRAATAGGRCEQQRRRAAQQAGGVASCCWLCWRRCRHMRMDGPAAGTL